jgi:DNA modification methylase
LTDYYKNPRSLSEKEFKQLKKSLDTFGMIDKPIVNLDSANTIIGGHQRKHVLEATGVKECECWIPDRELTDKEVEELNIRLNKNTGSWDFDTLANEFELDDLLDWGFDKGELDLDLWADDAPEDVEPQIDKAEELRVKWGVESGQLWQLGEHRLICGDCTDKAVVERVMGGEKARVVVTSPPYSNQRDYEVGEFDWQALARGFSDCVFPIVGSPGDVLINLGLEYKDGRINAYWNEWIDYCDSIGHPLYGWYIWDKGSGFPGEWNGRLAPSHEWVFHFSNGRVSANKWIETTGESAKRGASGKRFRQKDGSLRELTSPDKIGQAHKVPDSVIRITREMARGIHTQAHPAVFPVAFSEFIVQTWSNPGEIAYEPFSGSGTTIIACERLGRKCRAVEISPAYVAVAIQRWVDVTGKEPVLLDT